MRRSSILLVSLALGGATPPATAAGHSRRHVVHMQVAFSADALELQPMAEDPALAGQQPPRTRVSLRADEPVFVPEEPGVPALPLLLKTVAVPRGARIRSVRTVPRETEVVENVSLVSWTQLPRPGQLAGGGAAGGGAAGGGAPGGPSEPYFPPGPFVVPVADYLERERWPEQMAFVTNVSPVAGLQLATVAISPVEWRPREGRILFHRTLDVELVITGGRLPVPPQNFAEAETRLAIRNMLANPDALPAPVAPLPPHQITDAPYLIITDDHRWVPKLFLPGLYVGDMVAEFARLAQWKTQKGIKAEVVTLSDIVGGKYGNFIASDTYDLPEVIREFLKFARENWNTYWVLLGGDVSIIPPRYASGYVATGTGAFSYRRVDKNEPDAGHCYYDNDETVRLHQAGGLPLGPGVSLIATATGTVLQRVASPSPNNPGWAYMTSSQYQTESAQPTEFILLRAPKGVLQGSNIIADLDENRIPTDFYYASLGKAAPFPLPLDFKDWDFTGNQLFGQYSALGDLDGVVPYADLVVGRAPARDPQEARNFVDKVLAYEKYEGRSPDFARRLLLAESNWSGAPTVESEWTKDMKPAGGFYWRATGGTAYIINFGHTPIDDPLGWRLLRYISTNNQTVVVPYDENASTSSLGYFFCTDITCTKPSKLTLYIPFPVTFQLPTQFVAVRGPETPYERPAFIFDHNLMDPAAIEKDEIRSDLALIDPSLDLRRRLYADSQVPPAADLSPLTVAGMTNELFLGRNVVSVTGHGSPYGCCGFGTGLLSNYVNSAYAPSGIVYAESCLTNAFDTASISVGLLQGKAGAVSYVGNSRYGWIGHGHGFERAFWKVAAAGDWLGWAHDTRNFFASTSAGRWANFSLNLLGDPEMRLWLGAPIPAEPAFDGRVPAGQAFRARLATPAGEPIVGALLALSGPQGLLDVAFTNRRGVARLRTQGRAGDRLTLTTSAAGVAPTQSEIVLTPRARRDSDPR